MSACETPRVEAEETAELATEALWETWTDQEVSQVPANIQTVRVLCPWTDWMPW